MYSQEIMSLKVIQYVSVSSAVIMMLILMLFNLEQFKEYKLIRRNVTTGELFVGMEKTGEIIDEIVDSSIAEIKEEVHSIQLSASSLHFGKYCQCKEENGLKCVCHRAKSMINSRINYADILLGAEIVSVSATPIGNSIFSSLLAQFSEYQPENILYEDMQPGACFAFKNEATLTIRLSEKIRIDLFEIKHITEIESPSKDISSAPKDFSVYAIDDDGSETLLGKFIFRKSCSGTETFPISCTKKFQLVKVQIHSNHGNPNFTCVYRIGVYGK